MLLRLRNVARFYGSRLIFKDVSLVLRSGTVTLLAGANGAGKSTLLRIMAGLISPSSGTVERTEDAGTGGIGAGTTETDAAGGGTTGTGGTGAVAIGYLGHRTFLYPELSALENLAFWSALYGRDSRPATLLASLERVELSPFAEEKAGGFSRGMAQRLNLARILLLRPDLLLLDEPGTGLDTRATTVLYREIAAARARGAGVVWITHSLAEDLKRADMVAVLEKKRLARYCSVAEYTAAPLDESGEDDEDGGDARRDGCCREVPAC